jgi:aminoglycoside phosphotransferase (APT) family kinase protein
MHNSFPPKETIDQIIADLNVGLIISIKRFDTGKAHYVFDVKTTHDELVVRVTKLEQKSSFESAVYWNELLKPLGIPLPKFRSYDIEGTKYGFPVIVMDRLPGTDLLHVYKEMNNQQKETLAREIVNIQKKVGTLKKGSGFGYATSYDDPKLHSSWQGVMNQYMNRITTRNNKTGLINQKYIQRLTEIYKSMDKYLQAVSPTPFLDDTTTKNVIINDGKLSGIVDIDNVCFGDPLLTLALTQMALLELGDDTYYTDYWKSLLKLSAEQEKALAMYTGMFALEFASAMGQTFNKDTTEEIDHEGLNRLTSTFERITHHL